MTECDHPDCTKETFGGSINGAQVCMDHIEWAMGKAFAPIHQLEKILLDDERRDITRGVVGLPLTDEDCDVAEDVAAEILAEQFTTETKFGIGQFCSWLDEDGIRHEGTVRGVGKTEVIAIDQDGFEWELKKSEVNVR